MPWRTFRNWVLDWLLLEVVTCSRSSWSARERRVAAARNRTLHQKECRRAAGLYRRHKYGKLGEQPGNRLQGGHRPSSIFPFPCPVFSAFFFPHFPFSRVQAPSPHVSSLAWPAALPAWLRESPHCFPQKGHGVDSHQCPMRLAIPGGQ